MNYLGIDIGGTYIKTGIVDSNGNIGHRERIETPCTFDRLIEQTALLVEKTRGKNIKAVGVGIPGFISQKEKIIKRSPNIRFLDGMPFGEAVEKRTGVPVFLENDANAAAFGEFALLPVPRPGSFIHLTLGTGIGGGIILDNKIWTGDSGYAGELGHHIVNPEGRPCGCGGWGCIETEASATALVNTYEELTGTTAKPDEQRITSEEIHNRYAAGEEAAVKTFERAGYYLGIFLCSLINSLNPAKISLGGGAAAAGDALMKPALRQLEKRLGRYVLESTEITVSRRGSETGLIGAALWARAQVERIKTKKNKI